MLRNKILKIILLFIIPAINLSHGETILKTECAQPPVYINQYIESGTPLNWEILPNGIVNIRIYYDNQKFSENRAGGNWYFLMQAKPGSEHTLVLENFQSIWNGNKSTTVKEQPCFISNDGKNWKAKKTVILDSNRIELTVKMDNDSLFIAKLEPYRLSDLSKLCKQISSNPMVKISTIGKSVEKRDIKLLQIGSDQAKHRIFLRARAHPWETAGNWILQGLINELLTQTGENNNLLKDFCFYMIPIANPDGVARGITRFNINGQDLNRNWNKPADFNEVPENYAVEEFIKNLIEKGNKPDFAIDFHNDLDGKIHISTPEKDNSDYKENIAKFENLTKKYTWFTRGSYISSSINPGTIADGLINRFGIDAIIFEFHAQWIEKLDKNANANDWQTFGRDLVNVFQQYFK